MGKARDLEKGRGIGIVADYLLIYLFPCCEPSGAVGGEGAKGGKKTEAIAQAPGKAL